MNAFRDHADGGVQESYMVSHFSERVVMNTHRLIDPLIAGCPMVDTQEQLFQAQLLHERIGPQEHSRS